jgi:RNA polymerase sigma factor (TIGR02999 family)
VLVDHARARKAAKRGGGAAVITLNEELAGSPTGPRDVVALDDALQTLAKIDERKAKIIEMRFFAGMSGEEIAAAAGVSSATVTRELRMAQAWLFREMSSASAV